MVTLVVIVIHRISGMEVSRKPQRTLSQHLRYKHPHLSMNQRSLYLRIAQRVDETRRRVVVRRGQPTLDEILATVPPSYRNESEDEANVAEPGSVVGCGDAGSVTGGGYGGDNDMQHEGTRHFPRYSLEHPIFYRFENFLIGIDGGQRCQKTGREICIDVSKYACGSACPTPIWSRLTDRDQLIGYAAKLKRAKIRPEGQLSKLDAICAGLRFLKVHILADESHPLYSQASRMELVLNGWKSTLRKEKRKLQKVRLQKLSSECLSLEEVSTLLECQLLWMHFNQTCIDSERQAAISGSRLDQATIALAASLLFKNWQRPGAVTNATVNEFEAAKVIVKGGEPLYVMSVEHHKTSLEGFAKVVIDPVDHGMIIQYIEAN